MVCGMIWMVFRKIAKELGDYFKEVERFLNVVEK